MQVLRGFSRPFGSPTVLTVGNFDGVHLGHVALLARIRAKAEEEGVSPAVLTFEPHPREYFAPQSAPARLSTLREKLELLADCGVQVTMVCRFNARFAALSPAGFIDEVLVKALSARHLVVGDDFRFGQARLGDFSMLAAEGGRKDFSVEAMESVVQDGERVSSSAVRAALAQGDMERASRLLGRPYVIDGRVMRGAQLGRQLGFATANIRIKHDPLPMRGVFAVEVRGLDGSPRPGVANLGVRPTVGGIRPVLEVHLFDFERDIYGAHLSVRFVHKLREEKKFSNLDALKAQIAQDAAAARAVFRL